MPVMQTGEGLHGGGVASDVMGRRWPAFETCRDRAFAAVLHRIAMLSRPSATEVLHE